MREPNYSRLGYSVMQHERAFYLHSARNVPYAGTRHRHK